MSDNECYICHHPKDQPGALFCSWPHPVSSSPVTADDECPICHGAKEVWLGSQPYGSPGESYAPCSCVGREGSAK